MKNANNNSKRRRRSRASEKSGFISSVMNRLDPVKGKPDYIFLGTVIVLIAFGIIMLFSAGTAKAYADFHDATYFVKKQLVGVALGAFGMLITSKIDYHRYSGKLIGILYLGTAVLLFLVIAGLGRTVNGSTRWLFGFQPSEIAKAAIIMLFAYNLSRQSGQREIKEFKKGFLPYLILLLIYAVLLLLEPHLSCTILICVTAMVMLYVAGAPIKYFLYTAIPAIPAVIVLILLKPYMLDRIVTFANPFADMRGSGWQIVQSLYAIGSGGIFGVGLGQSRQKFQSLPEPHNDFIFSVLSEELGLIGAILLMALFVILLVRGIKIAEKAPDMFGTLLVVGFVGIVTLQAIINIAVVTASVPNTGMPLPFFSYGSTALSITMTEMGVVLNVSKQTRSPL